MSATTSEDQDMFCKKAVALIVDLCLDSSPYLDSETCQDFLLLLTNENPNISSSDPDELLFTGSDSCVMRWGRGGV
ncbi:putative synaptotagmin-6-like [Triplophysa rosa]|uniref:Synaptotagmin-6-like n=1 Tax=Triplophysa rosa TaxID=992332 RepID=A0A9W7WDP9_TRIRA|nr:putative synaptotagmin-6-like [Triplophysa rosa]